MLPEINDQSSVVTDLHPDVQEALKEQRTVEPIAILDPNAPDRNAEILRVLNLRMAQGAGVEPEMQTLQLLMKGHETYSHQWFIAMVNAMDGETVDRDVKGRIASNILRALFDVDLSQSAIFVETQSGFVHHGAGVYRVATDAELQEAYRHYVSQQKRDVLPIEELNVDVLSLQQYPSLVHFHISSDVFVDQENGGAKLGDAMTVIPSTVLVANTP